MTVELDERTQRFAALVDDEAPPRSRDEAAALRLVAALRSSPQVPPLSPTSRARLRQRLVAAAATYEAAPLATPAGAVAPVLSFAQGRHRKATTPLRRLGAGLVAAAAAATALAGVGVASQRSVPGDAFYAVKRASEQVHLALPASETTHARRQLGVAAERLEEIQAVTARSTGPLDNATAATVADLMGNWLQLATPATTDLLAAARSGNTDAGARLAAFAASQRVGLASVAPRLPATLSTETAAVLATLTRAETGVAATTGVQLPAAGSDAPAPAVNPIPPGVSGVDPPTRTRTSEAGAPSAGTRAPGTGAGSGRATAPQPGASASPAAPLPAVTGAPAAPLPAITGSPVVPLPSLPGPPAAPAPSVPQPFASLPASLPGVPPLPAAR